MNKKGHPQNLVAAHAGNTNAARHGAYSTSLMGERALEIMETFFGDYRFTPTELIAVVEVTRCLAILEAIDGDLDDRGLVDRKGEARSLLDYRTRISRRLDAWLTKIAATVDRQSAHDYEGLFLHDEYRREVKRIALGGDPKTTARERLDALKLLRLLQMEWAQAWLDDYLKEHPEKRAELVMEDLELWAEAYLEDKGARFLPALLGHGDWRCAKRSLS